MYLLSLKEGFINVDAIQPLIIKRVFQSQTYIQQPHQCQVDLQTHNAFCQDALENFRSYEDHDQGMHTAPCAVLCASCQKDPLCYQAYICNLVAVISNKIICVSELLQSLR